MAQLGLFDHRVPDTAGNAISGASVAIYREGATVNGNQSGVSPLTVAVRHRGKIAAADTVFINTTTGTTYSVDSVTATTVVLSGFGGTLNLTSGDRIIPSNSQPTLYGDDQGGATTSNPLTTSATGRAQCWMQTGAYDVIVSGGGAMTTAFVGQVTVGESPSVVVSGETDSATAVAHIEDTYFSMATAGAKLHSFRNLGTEKAAIDKDGTGIFPRIGQTSTATTGGAFRFVDGITFPLTVAGVQAALDECESAGGGTVYVPSNAGILLASTSIKIGTGCILEGTGPQATTTATFTCNASTNVSAMIENKHQDGTQQTAELRNCWVYGNSASGATVTVGVLFKRLFSGSVLDNVRVTRTSGVGIQLESTTTFAAGPYQIKRVVVADTGGHNISVVEGSRGMWFESVELDRPGANKACLSLSATADSSAQSRGISISNLYSEFSLTSQVGVLINNVSNVLIDGYEILATVQPAAVVQITGAGIFGGGSSGITVRNVSGGFANTTKIIDDQVSSVVVDGGADASFPMQFLAWYSTPVSIGTSGRQSLGQVVGLQYAKQGSDITAAATITPREGNFFVVTGNTNITSVTAAARDKGRIITFQFSGTPTFTDGSNLKLAGNLVATADDTITLVCDGTNWIEIARSVN